MQSLATMISKINTMITKTPMTMAVFYFIPSDLFFLHRPFNKVAICCVNYHASSVLHLLLSLLFTEKKLLSASSRVDSDHWLHFQGCSSLLVFV